MRKFLASNSRSENTPNPTNEKRLRLDKEAVSPAQPQDTSPQIKHGLDKAKRLNERRLQVIEERSNDPAFMEDIFEMYKRELLTTKELSDKNSLTKYGVSRIKFSPTFSTSTLRAIAVPKDVAQSFKKGEKLYLRGELDENVVLCSASKTYDLLATSTSSILAVCPLKPEFAATRSTSFKDHTILAPVNRRLCYATLKTNIDTRRLREMLRENELDWIDDKQMEEDTEMSGKRYSLREILRTVQISEGELRAFCKRLPIIEYQGKLCWMTHAYCTRLFDLLVDLLDNEDDYPDIEVFSCKVEAIREAFPDSIPDTAIQWLLDAGFTKIDGREAFKIDERRFVAQRLRHLLPLTPIQYLNQLRTVAERVLPSGCEFRPEYLLGVAIKIPHASGEELLQLLDKDELPDEHLARVKIMFNTKAIWAEEEFRAYLEDVFVSRQKMDEFIFENVERGEDAKGNVIFGGVIDSDC